MAQRFLRKMKTTRMTRLIEIRRLSSTSLPMPEWWLSGRSDLELDAGEIDACSCGISYPNEIDGIDDIGARLSENNDQNRRLPIGESTTSQILNRVNDLSRSDSLTGAPSL